MLASGVIKRQTLLPSALELPLGVPYFKCKISHYIVSTWQDDWNGWMIKTVCHILVECNHLAQTRKDIFGRRDVVKTSTFHPSTFHPSTFHPSTFHSTLVIFIFKIIPVLFTILIQITVIILFCTALYTVITIRIFNALFYLTFHSYTIV